MTPSPSAFRLLYGRTAGDHLPGRLRYDDEGGKSLVADPVSAKVTAATATDQALMETLQADSVDGFLQAMDGQAAMTVIARSARSVDERTRPATIQDLDIYEVVAAVDTGAGKVVRAKHYCFDAATHMLTRVRYLLGSGESSTQVEVSYSGWTNAGGQAVPGRIERRENGVSAFAVAIHGAGMSAAAKDGVFDQP